MGNSYLLCARPAYLSTVVRTGKHPAQRRHCCFVFATALLEAVSPLGARRQTFKGYLAQDHMVSKWIQTQNCPESELILA